MGLWWLQHMALAGSVAAGSAPASDFGTAVAATSPSAYWRMDEASGNLVDATGNGHTLTTSGTPTYEATGWASDGASITFGASDTFYMSSHADLNPGTGDWSVMWTMKHASGWPAAHVWFSFFLTWLIKSAIMRWGGYRTYQSIRPFFLGLLVGNCVAGAFWIIVGFINNTPHNYALLLR